MILIIPSRALWSGDHQASERRVHERFVGLLRQTGLTVIDMKSAFEQKGNPLGRYFITDPHWNPSGHAAAAEALLERLRTRY